MATMKRSIRFGVFGNKRVLHSFVLIQKNQKIKAYKTLQRQYSQIVSAGG
jgi:hypothetical protein